MKACLAARIAWLSAGAVIGVSLASGARADSDRDAAPAPRAAPPGPTDPAAPVGKTAPVAQAPAAPSGAAGSAAAPAAAAAPPAPEETEAPAPGSSRGLRIGGTGELLGWANAAGSMRQS